MKNGLNLKSWLATAILLLAGNLWTLGAGAAEVLDVPSRDDNASVIAPELYCVIDLSEGSNATNYPVSYLNGEPEGGFNTDEYKTTKLVLRRIAPGTFVMAGSCTVTLTKPFYIGIFEFTQKQYALVTGSNPSAYGGDKRPVDRVSWNVVRGRASTYNWPEVKTIDPNSFAARLRARTGLTFDLPTEAQWEYACRAGTTGDYNNGGDLGVLGRYSSNRGDGKGGYSEHTTVGSYLPNAWGLYDMHGNISEWCLDRWRSPLADSSAIDPEGPGSPTSGEARVRRGGSWTHAAEYATSSWRGSPDTPSGSQDYNGFRIACPASEKYEQSIVFKPMETQLVTNRVGLVASATSGNEVIFSVVSGPGLLEGDVLTFTEPGTVTIEASQPGDERWCAAATVTQEVEAVAVPTTVMLEGLEQMYDGEAKVVSVTTEPEGVAVRVTYDGSEEAPVHAGEYAVVVETADIRYTGRVEGTLRVLRAGQEIEFPTVGWQVWTNEVALSATAGSGLAVEYTVVSGPGYVEGNVLTFSGPGTVVVRASQAGDADWEAAEDVFQGISALKATATVTLETLAQEYDGNGKAATVVTIPEGIGVVVTYDGGAELPVNVGQYAVVATVVDDKWEGGAEGILVVSQGTQRIEFAEVGEQVATNVVELSATASTGLEVAFEVLSGPGMIEGNVLTFTGAGTVTVMAVQAGTENWARATVEQDIPVIKAVANVILGGLSRMYDGEKKAVEVTTVPEGLSVAVRYDGAAEAPARVGQYAVTVEVVEEKWEGYAEGVLEIAMGTQHIEFVEIGTRGAGEDLTLEATASSGLPVMFAVLSGPATLNEGVLRFVETGVVTVAAMQGGDENWLAAETVVQSFEVVRSTAVVRLSGLEQVYDGTAKIVRVETEPAGLTVVVTYDGEAEAPVGVGSYSVAAQVDDVRWEGSAEGTLVIAKGAQSIEFGEIGEQVATNVVELGATASSGLAVSYSVEGPVVLEGSALSFTGAGTVTVTASQAGDGNWEAAEDVVRSFGVVKASVTVVLGSLEQVFDNGEHGVTVETVPEGLSVAVRYDGEEALPVDAGSYGVVATVVDDVWEGSAEGTLVVAKGAQAIEFGEIGEQVATNTVTLDATASSGLAVSYSVEGPAVLEGSALSFTGAGVVTVTASQAGDGNWEAAEDVVRSFEVVKASAAVVLGSLEQVFDNGEHAVTVETVPEGLTAAVTYDGEEGLPVDAGSYGVVATVVDDVWEGSAEGTLVVAKGAQSIEFGEIGEQVATNTLTLDATASSGLAVEYSIEGPAVLEGSTLSFTGAGTVTVTASQAGDGNWEAAEDVVRSFEVVKASAAVALGNLEQVFDNGTHAVAVETVPEGLSVVVTYDGEEALPVDAGSYGVVATVVDEVWEGSAEGVLVVAKAGQGIVFPEIGGQMVTNRVELGAVASSGLPVGYAVVEGPGVVEGSVLRFTGVGVVAVVASQEGDGNWEAAAPVTNVVEVTGILSLTVESAYGVAVPGVGVHEVVMGDVVEASVGGSPEVLGEGFRAVCTGWRLEGAEGDPLAGGEGQEARFALEGDAVLTWLWETQALVRAEGLAHGTAEGSGWYALGAVAVLEAVPDEGHSFTGWEGGISGWQMGSNPLELAVEGPGDVLATFFTTYYAWEDGDDAASGLSWRAAKREVASALAVAARGDSVVASNGTYGAVSVPEGVSVRSVEGAEVTVIRGGSGVRCVSAEAGASVEGFALEGGEVEGDGGGAWLAEGAELLRCIVSGNKAGGVGGGVCGGTLENCLVVDNAAAGGGGGAAGAVLRHCTVVRNSGGGAKGCTAVNCVFWENEGGDVEGGATSWSLCNPAAAGAGNIEGDPCFAGEAGWRLAYESPCIDAGTDAGVRVDLDGAPRPQPRVYGGELKADMGCREYVPKARFVWAEGNGVPPYESWKDAARDIQSALDVSGGGDLVVVEAGTYGPIAVSNAVVLMGYRGAERTVIDAGGAERAVSLTGGGTLEGFTVRGGASEDCGGILADGGATVRDVVVEGCRATGAEGVGGGVCLYGGSVAENVTARGNEAVYGAGVYATETSAVVRCGMDGNAASMWGGGAYLEAESRMEGSALSGNTAVRGGGVYGADCEVADCELEGNAATGAGGGAALLRATFRNNRVAGNRASSGGGVHAQGSDGHDCLVTGNEAPKGAGVWMEGDGQFWNFTVADNGGTGAGVALRGTSVFGNGIAWGNAGGNLDAAAGTEVRYSCVVPAPEGEGNFAADPSFVGDGDYHLRAGSPCVDTGEVQDWMALACDFDGQRRVEFGDAGDGRDIWVDIGTDEAALDAVEAPSAANPWWTWRVVWNAKLQLQRAGTLLDGSAWEDIGAVFTATNGTWTAGEDFGRPGSCFYRLMWKKE